MNAPILFSFPGNDELTSQLATMIGAERGTLEWHRFPDGETHLRFATHVKTRRIIFVCTLDRPDRKFLPLIFAAATARELGASVVGLVAPYLGYMRQDHRFTDDEAVTAPIFADELSRRFDWLVTIDPHLHRYRSLSEVYSIPARALHSAPLISEWIRREIHAPLVIGPDEESAQWVSKVAEMADAPFVVLEKIRHGDRDVSIHLRDASRFAGHTPVLVDDIISTGKTMSQTVAHLRRAGLDAPVCVGVHAVFASGASDALKNAGAARIVTTNTIPHETNAIDIAGLIASSIK